MGAGAVGADCKDSTPSSTVYVQSYVVDPEAEGPPSSVKVGVMRHGSGAPAAEMASKVELVELHSRLEFGSMKGAVQPDGGNGRQADAGEVAVVEQERSGAAAMDSGLAAFLERLEASKYLAVFEKEEVRLGDLLSGCITEADMKEMGIALGPRRRILKEVARLAS
jgi:hypothetical protein